MQLHNLTEGSTTSGSAAATSERRRLNSEGDASHMAMVDSRQQTQETEEVEEGVEVEVVEEEVEEEVHEVEVLQSGLSAKHSEQPPTAQQYKNKTKNSQGNADDDDILHQKVAGVN